MVCLARVLSRVLSRAKFNPDFYKSESSSEFWEFDLGLDLGVQKFLGQVGFENLRVDLDFLGGQVFRGAGKFLKTP